MSKERETKRAPLQGTQIMSTVATGGGGGVFQARVGALYLANMLTGVPSAFGLHGARVETLRFEARYTGAHTDDIYCVLRGEEHYRPLANSPELTSNFDGLPKELRCYEGLISLWNHPDAPAHVLKCISDSMEVQRADCNKGAGR